MTNLDRDSFISPLVQTQEHLCISLCVTRTITHSICVPREVKRRQSYFVFSFLGVLLFSVFPVVNWCDPSDHVTPGAYSPCDHWGLELHYESLGNKGQCMSSILLRRTNKTSNHTPSLSRFFFLSLPYLQSKICPSQLGKCRSARSCLRKHFQFAAGPSDSIIQPPVRFPSL